MGKLGLGGNRIWEETEQLKGFERGNSAVNWQTMGSACSQPGFLPSPVNLRTRMFAHK
jgi:hypothetical protein